MYSLKHLKISITTVYPLCYCIKILLFNMSNFKVLAKSPVIRLKCDKSQFTIQRLSNWSQTLPRI